MMHVGLIIWMTWWTWTTLVFFCPICLFLCQTNITSIWLKKLMRCWWSGQAAQSAFETSAIIISLLYINHQQWTAAPLFFATLMFQNSSWSQFCIQLVNKAYFRAWILLFWLLGQPVYFKAKIDVFLDFMLINICCGCQKVPKL